jgi:TonB family protein
MTDRKSCIRCGRSIDEFARACPFCNWDQTQLPPTAEETTAAPLYVPPHQKPWRNKIIGIGAFIALVIVAFVVGTFIHGFEPSEVKAAQTKNETPNATAPSTPSPRSNVTFVPVNGSGLEEPITTAPATAPGQQPNDATALPADQYAAAAARAKAQHEAEEKTKSAMIDPRTLTANAYQPSPRAESAPSPKRPSSDTENTPGTYQPSESASTPMRTSAYLQYKPLPHITVDRDTTARLNLTIDPDGRVTDVDVNEPVPDMPKLLAAVQNWRFKPATENGVPVTSHVSVDITFRANE